MTEKLRHIPIRPFAPDTFSRESSVENTGRDARPRDFPGYWDVVDVIHCGGSTDEEIKRATSGLAVEMRASPLKARQLAERALMESVRII